MTVEKIAELVKSSQKTLWILCGLPYAGKTYVAKKILKKADCMYVSIDDILHNFGYDWNANKLPDEEGWKKIFALSYERSREALGAGKSVLYDSTNHTRESRDKLREVARSSGANASVIYVKAPVELVRKRWEENKRTNARFVLDEKLFEKTIEALEPPASDEDPVVVGGEQ